jgi:hypothetical protein
MEIILHLILLSGHEPIDGEFLGLALLNDAAFQSVRAKHLSRHPTPAITNNAGVLFLVSLFGILICFVMGIIKNDNFLLLSSIFWLLIGLATFFYLVFSATYWRKHRAIISEEFRRFGSSSFS